MKPSRRQRGEGSYDYIESKNLYRWRGYYKDSMSGENKRKELTANTQKALRQKVKIWQEEVAVGQVNRIKVSAWCIKWLEIVRATTRPATVRRYSVTVHCHIIPQWGEYYIDKITHGVIQDYINDLADTHTTKTLETLRAHVRACFALAIKYGFLSKNPALDVKIPKKNFQLQQTILNETEVTKLISVAKEKIYKKVDDANKYLNYCYYCILKVAIATGMRQGEIFGLTWDNVNFATNNIYVKKSLSQISSTERLSGTKTGKCRNIIIDNYTMRLLKRWCFYQKVFGNRYNGIFKNVASLVFTNSIGHYLSATNFSKRYFRPLLKEADLSEKIHFHTLRHTHASMLLAKGVNVQIVSERLGHSSVSITMNIYAHILPTLQDSAKNILENLFHGGNKNG